MHRRFCGVLLGILITSLACAVPDRPLRFELTIPAGLPLDQALQELALQSGIQFVFFSQVTAGRSGPAVSGEFTLPEAMALLLEGSDLTFRHVNAHTIEVSRQVQRPPTGSAKRRPTTLSSADIPMEEVLVVATVEQLVATRIPTPLSEIPQSLSVISAEQIRQQNSVDLGDVMRNAPGIATRRTSSLEENAYSRAFPVSSFHVDGGGALKPALMFLNLYQGSPDLSEFDRVEVLRGSDTLFTGNTYPGGTVSLVRKRPLRTPALNVSASLGSWNNYRAELDATGPLSDDGSLRGRVDAVYNTRDYFFDLATLRRKKLFAALEYDITPTATLTVGGSYQWDDTLPFAQGLPLYSDGTDARLPRSTALTFDWAFYDTRSGQAYLQYRQQFAETWNLRVNTAAGRTIVEYGYGQIGSTINRITRTISAPVAGFSLRPAHHTLGSVDATLSGEFNWFGLRELIAVGADFTHVKGEEHGGLYLGDGSRLAIFPRFDSSAYPDPRITQSPAITVEGEVTSEQHGAFVSLQVDALDRLSLSGGARIASDRFRLKGTVNLAGMELPASSDYGSSNVITPFAGLLYRLNQHYSWYASYADVYLTAASQPPLRADGSVIGPSHGVTQETGIKATFRDGALNASLAVYKIRQSHVLVPDDSVPSPLSNCCFLTGTAHSRGAELQIDGALASDWLIGSGYTYNFYESDAGGIPNTVTPRHLLKIWTSKRLPDALSRWTVGGSLRARTESRGSLLLNCTATPTFACVPTEVLAQAAYAVLDLRVGFEVATNWQVALSVNNVADKTYYLSQNSPGLLVWYGEPRNFLFRVDAKY